MNSMFKVGILLSLTDMASAGLAKFGSGLEQQTKKGEAGFKNLGSAAQALTNKHVALGSAIKTASMGMSGNANALKRQYAEVGNALAKIEAREISLAKIRQNSSKLIVAGAGSMAVGSAMTSVLATPVQAFVRLDDAMTELKSNMMDSTGKIGSAFDEIMGKAIDFGNALPGETTDYVQIALALKQQGMADKALLGSGLEAASYLKVVTNQPGYETATLMAKQRESYKLGDNEIYQAADNIQRSLTAFGMTQQDLAAATSYDSSTLNMLGITGLANQKKILAMQGINAGVGLDGSSFGTNMAMMMTRFASGPLMVEEAKKGMKADARDMMEQSHVSFDFFDKKGNFKGLDNVMVQMDKLNIIKKKFGEKGALMVAEGMFGTEGGRPAMNLANAGVKGYEAAQAKIDTQGDLKQRAELISNSTSNTWGKLAGTANSTMGLAAGPAVESLKPVLNYLNGIVGATGEWVKNNQTAAKWIGLISGGAAGLATVLGGTLIATGIGMKIYAMALGPAAFLMKGFGLSARLVGTALTFLRGSALVVGRIMMTVLTVGLRQAATAVLWLGRALLMNPIGLLITALAIGAFLVYKNWDTIKNAFQYSLAWWTKLGKSFYRAGKAIVNDLGNGIASGYAWVKGKFIALGTAIKSAWSMIKAMGTSFYNAGADLIQGLINGVTSKLQAAKEKILEIGAAIKSAFTSALDIHSPSRVFAGYGANISLGLAQGIERNAKTPERSIGNLSARIATAGRGPAGGGNVVHFSPTVHVQGGGDVKGQVIEALRISQAEFERMYKRMSAQNQRRAMA